MHGSVFFYGCGKSRGGVVPKARSYAAEISNILSGIPTSTHAMPYISRHIKVLFLITIMSSGWMPVLAATVAAYAISLFPSSAGAHTCISCLTFVVSSSFARLRIMVRMLRNAARRPCSIVVNCSNAPSVLFRTLPSQGVSDLRMLSGLLFLIPRGKLLCSMCVKFIVNAEQCCSEG